MRFCGILRNLKSVNAIYGVTLASYSEQQVLDCTQLHSNLNTCVSGYLVVCKNLSASSHVVRMLLIILWTLVFNS